MLTTLGLKNKTKKLQKGQREVAKRGEGKRNRSVRVERAGRVSIPDGIWAQELCHNHTLENRRGQSLPHQGCSATSLQIIPPMAQSKPSPCQGEEPRRTASPLPPTPCRGQERPQLFQVTFKVLCKARFCSVLVTDAPVAFQENLSTQPTRTIG